jgi:vitamin B12 transporter
MKQQFSSKLINTLLCGVVITFHATVIAQSNSTISVTNSLEPMNPIIVTATRTPKPAKDVLADFTYIGNEEIQQAAQTTLVELLQQQRGVQVTASGGGNAASSVFLRGNSNSQSIVLIDGVRSEQSYMGGPTWGNIPLSLIDHIEIIYGPQSSIYGADAIGGVIQIFTKKGEGPPKLGMSTGYGSYGTSISDASLYGATDGEKPVRYSLSVSQELSMGYPSIAGAGNNRGPSYSLFNGYPGVRTGYSKVGATGQLSQQWQIGNEIGIQFFQSKLNNQLPGKDYFADGINGTALVGQQIGQIGQYSVYSNDKISDSWSSRLQLSTSFQNDQTVQLVSSPNNTKQNIYTWQNDFKLGEDTLQLLLERRTQSIYALSYYDPTGLGGPNSTPTTLNQERNINSGALAYSLKRDSNLLNLSARRDYFTGWGAQNTGNVSYGYFLTNKLRANINYGTGFRAPDFSSLYLANYGNPNLLPEKSKNVEGGIHYQSRKMDANVVVYNNTVQNLITYGSSNPPCTDAQVNAPPNYGCAANVGLSKISGLSLGSTARLNDFAIKGSFDQMNPINQLTGNTLALRARQTGNLELGYQGSQWQATINGSAVGRRYDSGQRGLGGYAIFNGYTSYAMTKDWALFGRVNNIFNKYYQLNYGWNPPGVSVFAGIRYAMK